MLFLGSFFGAGRGATTATGLAGLIGVPVDAFDPFAGATFVGTVLAGATRAGAVGASARGAGATGGDAAEATLAFAVTGAALRGLATLAETDFAGAVAIIESFTKYALQFRLADQPVSIESKAQVLKVN